MAPTAAVMSAAPEPARAAARPPCRRPAALRSPEARPLSARSGDAGCKLPAARMRYSPPALMVSSLRSLEGEPAVPPSPSVLWPPTPSPTAAFEQALRMPMATVLESRLAAPAPAAPEPLPAWAMPTMGGAAFFAPFVEAAQQLAAGCGPACPEQPFFTTQGRVGEQMPAPFWQFAPPPPPPPPAQPAPEYMPPAGCALGSGCAWMAPAAEPSLAAPRWNLEVAPLLPQPAAGAPAAPAPAAGRGADGSAQPAPAPSAGSALHGARECKPCAWYYKPRGCDMGSACSFCHLCLEGEVKNRKKGKAAAIRRTFQEVGVC